jgi:hypothetical protein
MSVNRHSAKNELFSDAPANIYWVLRSFRELPSHLSRREGLHANIYVQG